MRLLLLRRLRLLEPAAKSTGTIESSTALPGFARERYFDGVMSLILLVDDDPFNRQLFRALLETAAHTVIEAEDVASAKSTLSMTVPELLLLDMQLPGGGGEAVLAHIKATPALAAMRVAACTALSVDEHPRLRAAGCHAIISKPINVRDFTADVARVLSGATS